MKQTEGVWVSLPLQAPKSVASSNYRVSSLSHDSPFEAGAFRSAPSCIYFIRASESLVSSFRIARWFQGLKGLRISVRTRHDGTERISLPLACSYTRIYGAATQL